MGGSTAVPDDLETGLKKILAWLEAEEEET